MAPSLRWWIAGVVFGASLLSMRAFGEADGSTDSWRAVLPKEVYRELTDREIRFVRELLKDIPDKRSLDRARFGAVLIAALTMSVKEGAATEDVRNKREMALRLATTLRDEKQLATARKLAGQFPDAGSTSSRKLDSVNWHGFIEAPTLMVHFLPKNEGGDGIHPKLQSNARLKGANNGILEKIRYLSTNELTATALASEAKELELFGYRSAVIGSLVYHLVPAKMKPNKTPKEWRDLAIQMRDHSLELAEGAQKRDSAAVLRASKSLRSACSRCHNVF